MTGALPPWSAFSRPQSIGRRLPIDCGLRQSGSQRFGRSYAPAAAGETVLVVEDNPELRTLSLDRLRRLGGR